MTQGSTCGRLKKSARSALSLATSDDADGFVLIGTRKERGETYKRPTAVIGTRTGPNELRVINERLIPVFISRLVPSVNVDDIIAYGRDVQQIEVNCGQLETRHDSYSSFKIEVTCKRQSNFIDAKKWPAGAYVRRFFTVKK